MAEVIHKRKLRIRHRGRMEQIRIYLGKMLRMFVYENDWKVLPMAALIAALVSMVIRTKFFMNMEGDLLGAFSITCVAIWNGCFNSIQVICRERAIIKREHRSGMHISSYILSHMIYQALLCLAQSALTVVVCRYSGVQFPEKGFITKWMMVDVAITIFLISYASDMLSLWISAVAHSTTTAMTIMPFVLIFQLVFSGGIFQLAPWAEPISGLTISSYGLKCIATQADYNHAPMETAWNVLLKLKDKEIGGTVKVGQILDFLSDQNNSVVADLRAKEINATTTVGELWKTICSSATYQELRKQNLDLSAFSTRKIDAGREEGSSQNENVLLKALIDIYESVIGTDGEPIKLGEIIDYLQVDKIVESMKDQQIGRQTTVGELIDLLASNSDVKAYRDKGITVKTTYGRLMELVGEDKVKDLVRVQTAAASRVPAYDRTLDNIMDYWFTMIVHTLVYAFMAMISLEFIDKDRR